MFIFLVKYPEMEVHILSSGTRKILLPLLKFFFVFTQINDVLFFFFLFLSMSLITLFCTLLCAFVLSRLLFLHTSNARYLISVIFSFSLISLSCFISPRFAIPFFVSCAENLRTRPSGTSV